MRLALGALVALTALSAPASASAADWYVATTGADDATCGAAANDPCRTITWTESLAAVTHGDTIHIAAGEYDDQVGTSKRLNFVGAGAGAPPNFNPATDTFIDGDGVASNFPAIWMLGGGSVTGVGLRGPDDIGSGQAEALRLDAGSASGPALSYTVSDVIALGASDFQAPQGGAPALRVSDDNGTGRQVDVSVSASRLMTPSLGDVVTVAGGNVAATIATSMLEPPPPGRGLTVEDGAAGMLDRSQVLDTQGPLSGVVVQDTGSELNVVRSEIYARQGPLVVGSLAPGPTTATVTDSLIAQLRTTNQGGDDSAAAVVGGASGTNSLVARGTTFVARGPGVDVALKVAGSFGASGAATADVDNSVVRSTGTDGGFPAPVDVLVDGNTGGATLSAGHSGFTTLSAVDGGSAPGPGSGTNVSGDPLFVSDSTGPGRDFALQAGSPLIDRGDPSLVAPGQLDLAGTARSLDGNLDCLAAPDPGAYELAGQSAPCPPASPGGVSGGPGSGAGPGAGNPAPRMDAFALVPRTFRAYARGGSIAAARGARVRYRLSEAATVRFTVLRRTLGRRVGRRCRRPSRTNRRRPRCIRLIRVRGSFSHRGRIGRNSFRFRGRMAGRKLAPGRYYLAGVPTDAAGLRGRSVRAAFRIVAR
jgi:hypothetical protein